MSDHELFPFQKEGAQWLTGQRFALLADEMGLGKTVQAITAADRIDAKTIRVLCPAVARFTWAREFGLWSPTRPTPLVVTSASELPPIPAPTTICSYDLASVPRVNAWLRKLPADILIPDEFHYLKTPDAKRTQAVFGADGLGRDVGRIWCLSGTPAPNHAGELWVLLRCFGLYAGDYDAFIGEFCNSYESPYGRRVTGTKVSAIPRLRALLEPIILRRKKADVLKDLPPIYYGNLLEVEPGPVDLELCYPDYFLLGDRSAELQEKLRSEHAVLKAAIEKTTSAYMKGPSLEPRSILLESIHKSVSSYRRYVGLQKMPPLADLVANELESGAYEKIVIFAVHRDVIEGFRSRLSRFGAVTLYGNIDPHTREVHIQKFQTNPRCRVFVGNIQAAGTNINLTAAHNVLVAEPDWVPGNNAQAIMRTHRIGQTMPVYVRFAALANNPLDISIQRLLRRKARELTEVFDVKSHMRIFE